MNRVLKIGRKWLYVIHRWLGIASCLLFAVWFVSGLVMMYVPYPSVTDTERLGGLQPIAWSEVKVAPTAAMGCYPFAPAEVTACLKAMKTRYGAAIYTRFGFLDSFNPTLTERQGRLQHGRIVPGVGWVDGDYLGLDQGPIVIQIENGRSDAVWRRMRGEPNLVRGLKRAGFTGGWLDRA